MTVNFSLDAAIDNYCVMGNPVAHSKSPVIHQAFAGQTGKQFLYQAILVEPGEFNAALDEFQRQGGKGLNITVPFKEEAWQAVTVSTHRAQTAAAINTIWFGMDGTRYGDTTDGVGLIRDLQRHRIQLRNRRILVIGAGGAVRSVLNDLIDAAPVQIVLTNRTIAKAELLLKQFSDATELLQVIALHELTGQRFDVIINGTSAGLTGDIPDLPADIINRDCCCYDMVYGETDTPFVSWCKRNGAGLAVDGLGMLVEQAAESFSIWHGIRPATEPVIKMLRGTTG